MNKKLSEFLVDILEYLDNNELDFKIQNARDILKDLVDFNSDDIDSLFYTFSGDHRTIRFDEMKTIYTEGGDDDGY